MKTAASFHHAIIAALVATLGPFAPSSHAQGTCADLNIISLTYPSFGDSAVEVIAHTGPGAFFSYPAFSLVDTEGDTLTREFVNFFGINEYPQSHSSPLIDGQVMPSSPFSGTLLFMFSGGDGVDTCVYPINASLCPPEPCSELQVFFYNNGAVADASFNWNMADSDGNSVGSGTLVILSTEPQQDLETLCLPPGAYTLSLEQVSGPPSTYPFGVTRDFFNTNGPSSVFVQGQANALTFDFFELCFEGTNAIAEQHMDAPLIAVADGIVTIARTDGAALGMVEVFDASGRVLHRLHSLDDRTSVDLRSMSVGAYLLRVIGTSTNATAPFVQRIILN